MTTASPVLSEDEHSILMGDAVAARVFLRGFLAAMHEVTCAQAGTSMDQERLDNVWEKWLLKRETGSPDIVAKQKGPTEIITTSDGRWEREAGTTPWKRLSYDEIRLREPQN